MFWKKAGLLCIVAVALAIVGYGQTSAKQRPRSANLQGSPNIGYLGVGVQTLTDEHMKALNLKDHGGAEVTAVTEGAPAARAGIHLGDVILEANGQKIDGKEQFLNWILGQTPGTKVSLTVVRNGVRQNPIVATLGIRPADLPISSAPQSGPPEGMIMTPFGLISPEDLQPIVTPKVGYDGEPLTAQLAEFFGVREGVLVRSVTESTPAAKAGLKAGDVITKVNGMPVASAREISGIVRQAKKVVVFTVVRNKREITLNVELASAGCPPAQFDC